MTFLNPWLLAGMAAIGAPIIIHMMMRRQVRRMDWAAMRFLQVVVQRNEKKLRVEDLFLLVLRCLLLILLALALARPAFRASGMAIGGGSRTAIIAIDNSRSMGVTDGGASRFENAKKAANQILDTLPPGSSVALLMFSDIARPLIAEPATDLNLARKLIGDATLTDRTSNIHPVVRAAMDIVKRHPSSDCQVYILTDAQATGWKELSSMRADLVAQPAPRIVILVPGPGEQPNLGVSDLTLGGAMVSVGTAARFSVEVTNYGREDVHNIPVSLGIDSAPPGDQAVIGIIPAGASRRVSLFVKARTAGCHAVTAILPGDHLAADDRRTIVVRSIDEVRVLIVPGSMGATPREGDAFFLERALAPVASKDRDHYFIKPRVVSLADLPTLKLADFSAIILADVPSLPPETVAALGKYVRDGGGLMVFPGDKTDAAFYNAALGKSLGLLPAAFGPSWGSAADEQKYRTLQPTGYTHPMVSIWQDSAAGTLTSARFFKGIALNPLPKQNSAAGETVTVLTYADGAPAIDERPYGDGRVIQFSSTANTAWNDLPAHPAFVPVMQRALGRLVTRRDEALNIPAGGVFTYPANPDWLYKEMTVTPPGAAAAKTDKSPVGLVNGTPLLRYANTDMAGAYDVAINSDPPAALRFAAQASPEESTMFAVPDADMRSLTPGTQVIHWTPGTDTRQALSQAGAGGEMWRILAVLALGVACCETFVAGRFSAAK